MPPDDNAYAYSFLYPYSDDLLDGNEVTTQQKKVFCQNIATKILGGSLKQLAFDSTENKDVLQRECRVYQLVDQVLLSNTSSHALRESLCAINHAQLASMKQLVDSQDIQATVKSLSKQEEAQIFEISVNKGVASVMPDAYFCYPNGSLTKEQAELVAMVGAIGQFINDIEGLFDDLRDKLLTPALISLPKTWLVGSIYGKVSHIHWSTVAMYSKQVSKSKSQSGEIVDAHDQATTLDCGGYSRRSQSRVACFVPWLLSWAEGSVGC